MCGAEQGMTYSVKEIFYTLQGEGINAGRPAVFCRFAGCNLWSGREEDRVSAQCKFCDTEFVGTDGTLGAKYKTANDLARVISGTWLRPDGKKFVVLTGGEPLMQVDQPLVEALHAEGFEIAVETNGSVPAPDGLDWLCVSPKTPDWKHRVGDELKLAFPQPGMMPENIDSTGFKHRLLQPIDGPRLKMNIEQAIAYCRRNPEWRLSVQIHKVIGVR